MNRFRRQAIAALTFANYIVDPFYPPCPGYYNQPDRTLTVAVAACCLCESHVHLLAPSMAKE